MARRLRTFISTGPDLVTAREVVGQAIAGLPISLGWVIKYTPERQQPWETVKAAVEACDFYALLLGSDISAPVGSELYVARSAGKRISAFLKEIPRTPAAQVFMKQSPVQWRHFRSEEDLESLIQKAIVDQILELPETYGITVADWEALSTVSHKLGEEALEQRSGDTPLHGGAGSNAVIVAPGRDLPSQGVPIDKPDVSS
jgi:hypothetical protein